jgi:hypothetical protein
VAAGLDVDAGVLRLQLVPGVAHDQALDRHVGGGHAKGVAALAAAERRPANTAQRQWLVDAQVLVVEAALDLDHVARLGTLDHRLDGFARPHAPGGGTGPADVPGQQRQAEQAQDVDRSGWLHAGNHPRALSARNSTAPISRFLKPT